MSTQPIPRSTSRLTPGLTPKEYRALRGWLLRDSTSPEDVPALESIGCRLIPGSLYERIEF